LAASKAFTFDILSIVTNVTMLPVVGGESKEPDYNDDKDQLEVEQEKETGELEKQDKTTNQVF
jgi:hypothetical protein